MSNPDPDPGPDPAPDPGLGPRRRHGGAERRRTSSDRRLLERAGWAVAAIAVIGTSLFAGSLYFGRDDDRAAGPEPSISPLTTVPTSPSTSSTPSSSPSPGPTAEGMTAFLTDYLQKVADDPATAWGELGPGFQRTSGGFADYRDFWAPIAKAVPSNVRADPQARTVAYDVRYTYADGHTTTDSTRLTLGFDQGTYRITGEG